MSDNHHNLCYYDQSDRLFPDGTRQMESPEKGLADSGSYLVSVCHLWWQHRQYSRYVSLPPQDPPLVFFIWIATDLMCAASAHLSDLAFPC